MEICPTYQWFEELPLECPPGDSVICNGRFYRIAIANPASDRDFFSQRKLQPNKLFPEIDECTVRSLSLFDDLREAEKRLKLPKFREAHIVEINFESSDGKIKKTFGPSHFSWWRSKSFNIDKTKLIK